jgi:PAS domain S-box-containing protein
MLKCFLIAAVFLSTMSLELFAQPAPLDRQVRDSLLRVKPHASQAQKARIYLEVADLIKFDLPEKAFSYIVSAFKIAILENNDDLKAIARMKMGDYFGERRKFILAQEQYLAAWKTYQKIKNTEGETNAILRIGTINRSLGNSEKALDYLKKGLDLAQKGDLRLMIGLFLEHIGLTYQSMGDFETALYFYNKALKLFRQAGDKKNEYQVQNNIGGIFLDQERYDEGLKFFTSLLQDPDTTDRQILGILYTRISHIYFKKKDNRTSLKYNMKALAARQQNKIPLDINSSLINVAGDYYNLDKPDSGKIYMDSGLVLAKRFDRINLIENGYRHLYAYYLRKGDFKEALDYYTRNRLINAMIIRERSRNNIAIIEINQQLQRVQQWGKIMAKRHDIRSLNIKLHDYQTNILKVLLSLAGFSMLVFVLLLIYIRNVRRRMQELNVLLSEEIREREATEDQTRDRENQYKFITDNSVDFITHMDHEGNRIYASPAALNVYGYEPGEIITKSSNDLTHLDYHAFTELKLKEMVDTRLSQQFIYKALKKDGTIFWVESILNPFFDPISGVFKGMVGVTRDIQERKNKEFEIMEGTKQKENLLKEIHHRVKNNFAILVSLINMQMAQTKNPELLQSLTNLQLRIRTMALVHEMLYRSSDFEKISFPGYLRSLASVIAGTYNRRNVELNVEAEEVVMDIEASIPLGLIINEILSNAYKHAFPEERAGKISIRFTMDHHTGINTLVLQDDGIGMPDVTNPDQFKTMGLQVVQILCAQIEATLDISNNPGATFSIKFHASEK